MIFRELPQFNGKYFFTKIQTNDKFLLPGQYTIWTEKCVEPPKGIQ